MEDQRTNQGQSSLNENRSDVGTPPEEYGISANQWSKLDQDTRGNFNRIVSKIRDDPSNQQKWLSELTAACGTAEPKQMEQALNRIVGRVLLTSVQELHEHA